MLRKKTWCAMALLFPLLPLLIIWMDPRYMLFGGWYSFFIFAPLVGGIPYVIFYIATLIWMRGKTGNQVQRASWYFPLMFSLIFSVIWMFYDVNTIFIYIGLCIVIGYVYVIAVHLLTKILQKLNLVER